MRKMFYFDAVIMLYIEAWLPLFKAQGFVTIITIIIIAGDSENHRSW